MLFIVLIFGAALLLDNGFERWLESSIEKFTYRPRVAVSGGGDVQAAQNNPQTSSWQQQTAAEDDKDKAIEALKQQISQLQSQVGQYQERVSTLETRKAPAVASESAILAVLESKAADTTGMQTGSAAEEGRERVLQSIEKWRAAWQAQNVAVYIAQYTDNFQPANGQSREAWMRDRRVKLMRPKTITVRIDNLQVQRQDRQRWKATFLQRYQSDTYQDVVTKELLLIQVDDHYLIEKEKVL